MFSNCYTFMVLKSPAGLLPQGSFLILAFRYYNNIIRSGYHSMSLGITFQDTVANIKGLIMEFV